MNTKEIEVRFLNIDKLKLIKTLELLNFINKGESLLSEIIFYDPKLEWLKENRLVKLRTRGKTTNLIYKQNKGQTIDSAYEIEFGISDKNKAIIFLEAIGLVAHRYQEKKRQTLVLNNIIVDIDTWPNIPPYVEFEGPSEQVLKSFVESIGFNWSQAVFDDPRYILEKKYGIQLDTLKYFNFEKSE